MRIYIESDLPAFSSAIRKLQKKVRQDVRQANVDTAVDTLMTLYKNASGRPGPEIVSGEFVSKMEVRIDGDGMGFTAGNPSPQAARLEMGFVGVDRAGRHYRQPSYPWLVPTFIEIKPIYVQRLRKAIKGEYT